MATGHSSAHPARVVVVDDSALMRGLLSIILNSDPDIEVVGAAPDPYVARTLIKQLNPDVLTLDVEMPRMDGIAFLEKIMTLRPMPVVMVSSLTQRGCEVTLQALEIGAVDVIAKPSIDLERGLHELAPVIAEKVKAAAQVRVRAREATKPSAGATARFRSTEKVLAIGASTGGVEAVTTVIEAMPASGPATLVVQHMPPGFTRKFAERLDKRVRMRVCEAQDRQRVLPGHVYISPGDRHLQLARSGANYVCRLSDGAPVSGHRPSVDVLFDSVAEQAGADAVGVILTGMGKDGAAGLKAMHDGGAATIGQDETSSLVYGMPRVAFEMGGVGRQLSLEKIAQAVLDVMTRAGKQAVRI